MSLKRVSTYVLVAVVVALCVSGCGSKVNDDNFNKIKSGMTAAEVEAILGKPTGGEGGSFAGLTGGTKVWEDGNKKITVTFVDDKVVTTLKSGF